MFGERLRQLRINKDLTQEELGKILNKTKNSISQYETGKREPDSDTLKFLADYFSVSIDYLLGRVDVPNLSKKITDTPPTKKDLKDHNEFLKEARAMFMNDQVAEEDKEKIFKDISDLFWESKKMNKEKYGRKKEK